MIHRLFFPWKKLSRKKQRIVIGIAMIILIVGLPLSIYSLLHLRGAEAAWFNDNWGFRQAIPVTSTEGSAQSNVFVSFTLDTATLITAGKLQGSCQDIRITDVSGKLLKYHIGRSTGCNSATTAIDFLLTSFPDGQSTYYVYYGNPSASSADGGTLTVSQASAATVTASGNEITDVVRTTNTSGDGVTPPDSSYGVWQGTTNLVTNGGFETDTTGWTSFSATIARSTAQAKFGTASLLVTPTAQYGEMVITPDISVSPSTTYTTSIWINRTGITDNLQLFIQNQTWTGNLGTVAVPKALGWQRVTLTYTTASSGDTGIHMAVWDTAASPVDSWYLDGVQFEASSVATPYVETNGGTAARSAGRVQAPPTLINPVQGWFSTRVTLDFASSAPPASTWLALAFYRYSATDRIMLEYVTTTRKFSMSRMGGGVEVGVLSAAQTFSAGTTFTIIGYWTATQVAISVNGGAFTTQANTNLLTNNPTTFDIGSQLGTSWFIDGRILWTSVGTGTLANSDASAIHYFGNTDPTFSQIATLSAGLANPTILWTANTTADTQTIYSQSPARNYTIGTLATEEVGAAPIGYWKFDEGTGTNAKDSSSNQVTGTLTNMASPASTYSGWISEDQCISQKCLGFDGIDDYVSIADNNALDSSTAWTVGGWFNPTDTVLTGSDRQELIAKAENATGQKINYELFITTAGKLAASVSNSSCTAAGTSVTGTTVVQSGKWYHAMATFDGATGNLKIYVNGMLENTNATGYSGACSNAGNLRIGQFDFAWSSYRDEFKGRIDEVRIYRYARSAAQIKVDYNSRGTKAAGANVLGANIQNQPSALSNGLVGYWKMDEATWSGTLNEVLDSSGLGNNGQAQGATGGMAFASPSGKFANAGYFDGVDDYVNVGDQSTLDFTGSFTISAWIKTTQSKSSGDFGPIMGKGFLAGGVNGYGFYFDGSLSNKVTFQVRNGATLANVNSTNALNDGIWHHLVGIRNHNTNTSYIYVDGVLNNTSSGTALTDYSSAANFTLGTRNSGGGYLYFYNGLIDEARMYNRALSPADVATLYEWAPGPVGYWNFDQASGNTVNDLSGNSNTGTWGGTSATHWKQGKYGKAGNFDGSTDYVSVNPASSINNLANGSFTASAWIRMTAQTSNSVDRNWRSRIIEKRSSISGQGWILSVVDNKDLNFATVDSLGADTYDVAVANVIILDKWQYVSVSYDSSTKIAKLYVDSIEVTYVTQAVGDGTSFNDSLQNLSIGNATTGEIRYFTGQIDEVKIYNYARTAKQIVSDMNASHPNVGSPVGSPLLYLKLDDGFGNVASNSGSIATLSAGLYNMTNPAIVNSGWTQNGKFGKALSFDGVNDYLSIPNNPTYSALDFTTGFTLSAWIKPSQTQPSVDSGIIMKYSDITHDGYLFWYNNNTIDLYMNGGNRVDSTTIIPKNQWTHVLATWDGTNGKIFVNGVLSKSTAYATAPISTSQSFYIGKYAAARHFAGLIDEVKIYNYALSASEVKTDYNRGSAMILGSNSDTSGLTGGQVASGSASATYCVPGGSDPCSAPIGEWNLDEASGGSVNDSSSNNNTGIWNGTGSHWTKGKYGKAGNFNGSDDYIDAGGGSSLNINNNFTIAAWIKVPSSATKTGMGIVAWGEDSAGKRRSLLLWNGGAGNNKVYLSGYGASANLSGTSTVDDNAWHYVAVTLDASNNAKIYVDGRIENSGAVTLNSYVYNKTYIAATKLTGDAANEYYQGLVDQVRIYNYTRTPAQIAWDYNRGAPVGWWKFNECQGTTAYDSSGFGKNGTITASTSGTQTTVGTCTTASTMWGNGATGKYNASLNFDGTDDMITIGNFGSFYPQGTLSFWINSSEMSNWRNPLHTRYNGGNAGIRFEENAAGNFSAVAGNDVGTYDSATYISSGMSTNTWYHIVYTWDTSTNWETGFLNGKQVFSNSHTLWPTTIADLRIGTGYSTDAARQWKGQIDDVRLFNYALTKQQIQQAYNQGAAVRFGPSQGTP